MEVEFVFHFIVPTIEMLFFYKGGSGAIAAALERGITKNGGKVGYFVSQSYVLEEGAMQYILLHGLVFIGYSKSSRRAHHYRE
jgi:hypothetical protein